MAIYKFELPKEFTWKSTRFRGFEIAVMYGNDLWGHIDIKGNITVARGYAWDGCSPKWKIGNVIIGTPDGPVDKETGLPIMYYPSCIHDFLYQFASQIAVWMGKSDRWVIDAANDEFYDCMVRYHAEWWRRHLYYLAVCKFGYAYWSR